MKTFSSFVLSLLKSFSRRISNMQQSISYHQFNLMKDKHTINLILVSSKWLIPSFGVCSGGINPWFLVVLLFFSGVPSFLGYIIAKLHLNHRKVSPCVFIFSFLSFDHPFVTVVLLGGSTWWFIKDSFHSSIVLQDFSWNFDRASYTQR